MERELVAHRMLLGGVQGVGDWSQCEGLPGKLLVKREAPEGRWVPETVQGDLGRKQKPRDERGNPEGSRGNDAVREKQCWG